MTTKTTSANIATRFWSKVRRTETCWLWAARTDAHGYGTIWKDGRSRRAAQVACELGSGRPWPAGMFACHHCDNPGCVRPSHIFAGTQKDNMMDAAAKGRLNQNMKRQDRCWRGHDLTGSNRRPREKGESGTVCIECQRLHNQARHDPVIRDFMRRTSKRRGQR